ncbi:hypothetical protein R1flu_023450 [Riccia fluitans]|uniref:Peptidase C1A papain C-terminal domain-containing protein n=1 Tax=Riccia fluitans TaxID=41844 RepID=A0ABD1XW48_9MARC
MGARANFCLLVIGAALLGTAVLAGRVDFELELEETRPILQQSIVDRINNDKRATWKAGFNSRLENHSVRDFKRLCGTILTRVPEMDLSGPDLETGPSKLEYKELPTNFDAREKWPHCRTIGEILDQGHCGSCWAFGAVEALSDRFCIHGFENVTLSENDLLACCGFECGYGCEGGYPYRAWQYFKRTGVVSSTCYPYFDSQGCGHPGCSPVWETPVCSKVCLKSDELWSEQKHFAVSAYYLSTDPEILKLELYSNGPIEVDFEVYEDFAHYKSGIYQHLYGGYMGGHAVKLIGWGTENGVDYWTIANSLAFNQEESRRQGGDVKRGLNCPVQSGSSFLQVSWSSWIYALPFEHKGSSRFGETRKEPGALVRAGS